MQYRWLLLLALGCSCKDRKGSTPSAPVAEKIAFAYEAKSYEGSLFAAPDGTDFLSVASIDDKFVSIGGFSEADSIVGLVYFYAARLQPADTLQPSRILATGLYRKHREDLLFSLYQGSAADAQTPLILGPIQTSLITSNDLYALNDLYLKGKAQTLLSFIRYHQLNKRGKPDGALQGYLSEQLAKIRASAKGRD